MFAVYCPHLSANDPGGYRSFHRLFNHGTLLTLVYLDLEGAKIRAKDFCAFLSRHEKLGTLILDNILLTGPGSGLWREVYYAILNIPTLHELIIRRP